MTDTGKPSHHIEYDQGDGILICRLRGFLDEGATAVLARDLSAAIARIRQANQPILYLVDNREGRVVAPAAASALAAHLESTKRPGDRTAIVVSNSLSKLQAKRVTTTDHEVFVSENAARTWLTAYRTA